MTRIAFIVNGPSDGAMGHRARAFAGHLSNRYEIQIAYRSGGKILSVTRFLVFLVRLRPRLSYVFDMAFAGVLSAGVYRFIAGNRLIIDTGDAIHELARSLGQRSRIGLMLTRWLEQFSLRVADLIVVRGTLHKEWLAGRGIRAEVIQDGVEVAEFAPHPEPGLRREYQLDNAVTVGVLGSSTWSPRSKMCYGWELVEVMRLLRDAPVKGVMIGDGSGVSHLKSSCAEYGVADKVLFLGRLPYEDLPRYLQLADIWISTQTNDLVGRVRTTGKLPLYLAAGRYVLATKVGEASRILDDEMLVEYSGTSDPSYPTRLADRIMRIVEQPALLQSGARGVDLARAHFDYAMLAQRLAAVIDETLES